MHHNERTAVKTVNEPRQQQDATQANLGALPKASPISPQMACIPHNDTENYIDIAVGGRIRTTCRICKRFIGYRQIK
jgi:hypothetical protein